jgi:hypothetical protein
MKAAVARAVPGAEVMFVQGGAGDINPLFMARSGHEAQDFGVVQKMGEILAAEVVRANRGVTPIHSTSDSIEWRSGVVRFGDRWDPNASVEVGLTTVLINGAIAIAAVPGEPLHQLQRTWKERAEVAVPLFYGYTFSAGGTWAGYIPDLRSAAHGGYGADASTRIEIGAGERIMERHLINLYDMQKMWLAAPGRP